MKALTGATLAFALLAGIGSTAHAESDVKVYKKTVVNESENTKVEYFIFPNYACETENMQHIMENNPDTEFRWAREKTTDLDTGEVKWIESCYAYKTIIEEDHILFYPGDMDTRNQATFLEELQMDPVTEYEKTSIE